ncbi:MAG: hypothetical protein IPJ06_20145 [Saprospiraceae bacterium]|nr:hypothetical protein [Saprospiraceae bacterium]
MSIRSDYNRRYRFSGGGEITWTDLGREVPETGEIERDRLFKVIYTHRQDPKANPYHNISGRIHLNPVPFRAQLLRCKQCLANTISSSMNYRRTGSGSPYQFTAALTQSQNLRSGQIDMTLPEASFGSTTPAIQTERRGWREKWFEADRPHLFCQSDQPVERSRFHLLHPETFARPAPAFDRWHRSTRISIAEICECRAQCILYRSMELQYPSPGK